jgi:hypothetical protein
LSVRVRATVRRMSRQKELVAGGRVHGFCASGEGVILHSPHRSKNGASHRKNCDPDRERFGFLRNLMRSAMTRKNLLKRGNLLLSPSSRENEHCDAT